MLSLFLPSIAAAIELRAMPLEVALPKIGAAYAVPMRAAPAIAEEIVVARLDGAPLEDVKSRLAGEFAAEWRTGSDGTLYLTPSVKLRDAQRREWLNLPRQRMAGLILKSQSLVGEFVPFTSASVIRLRAEEEKQNSSYGSLSTRRPAGRLLHRLLADLRPESFAIGDPTPRTVLTLDPNAHQGSLGPRAREALRVYREESALWDTFEPAQEPVEEEEVEPRPAPGAPAKLLLEAEHQGNGTYLTLRIYDDSGRGLDAEILTIGDGSAPLAASPELRYTISKSGPTHPKERLQSEPLSFEASEILLSAARASARSLIVAPSDRLLLCDSEPSGTLAQYLNSGDAPAIRPSIDRSEPGWLRIGTDHPAAARAAFFPRKRLRQAINALLDPPHMSSAALFAYNRHRPERFASFPAESLILRAHPERWPFYNVSDLLLPASLTTAEWNAAARGPIPVSALNPRARALAERVLFHSPSFGARTDVFRCGMGLVPAWDDDATNRAALESTMLRLAPERELMAELPVLGVRQMFEARWFRSLRAMDAASKNSENVEGVDLDRTRFYERVQWAVTLERGERTFAYISVEEPPVPLHTGTYSRKEIPAEIERRLNPE